MTLGDSFVNWGFNPQNIVRRGGESFLISNSFLDIDEWPYTIHPSLISLNEEVFLEFMESGNTVEFAERTGIPRYSLTQLSWKRVIDAIKTYIDMGLEGDGLIDIERWTKDLNFKEWVKTGKSGRAQDRAWRNVGDDTAYSIDLYFSSNIIVVKIGEQRAWGDQPWAMTYTIKRMMR